MTVLAAAVVLQLAASCQAIVSPHTIRDLIMFESGGDTLAIHDNQDGKTYHPQSLEEAREISARLRGKGHSIDEGLPQINSANDALLGLQDPFDGCQAIAAQAALLKLFSRYNTGSPTEGIANGYAFRILGRAQHGKQDPPPSEPPPPPCAPAWDAWALAACSNHPGTTTQTPEIANVSIK